MTYNKAFGRSYVLCHASSSDPASLTWHTLQTFEHTFCFFQMNEHKMFLQMNTDMFMHQFFLFFVKRMKCFLLFRTRYVLNANSYFQPLASCKVLSANIAFDI